MSLFYNYRDYCASGGRLFRYPRFLRYLHFLPAPSRLKFDANSVILFPMKTLSIKEELSSTSYPGRGIILGKSACGKYAIAAYFIMGRSENSRNRVFVQDGDGIRTQAFDPSSR